MELEAVVGAVVELGERFNLPMVHTRTVYACAKLLSECRTSRPHLGECDVSGILQAG